MTIHEFQHGEQRFISTGENIFLPVLVAPDTVEVFKVVEDRPTSVKVEMVSRRLGGKRPPFWLPVSALTIDTALDVFFINDWWLERLGAEGKIHLGMVRQ